MEFGDIHRGFKYYNFIIADRRKPIVFEESAQVYDGSIISLCRQGDFLHSIDVFYSINVNLRKRSPEKEMKYSAGFLFFSGVRRE